MTIKNADIFKKIGFDETSQWVIYDDNYQKFFNWFTENITEENSLTENAVFEENELRNANAFLNSEKLSEKLLDLNNEYTMILDYEDSHVIDLKTEIYTLRQVQPMYENLNQDIEETKTKVNRELHNLEANIHELQNREETVYKLCVQKAKAIQDLQKENKSLCNELNDCFTKSHSPSLFTHQFPMDQYLLKCDSFMKHFTKYLRDHFKIQDFLENDIEDTLSRQDTINLENIKNQVYCYNEKYVLAKTEFMGLQRMFEELEISKVHVINIADIKKEIGQLEMSNGPNFDITYETLTSDLKMHLQQITQQEIELVLYQNTKQKLERANQRLENVKFLSKIVSDALTNTELVWIMMQLDCEKIKNRIDNTEHLIQENKLCCKRIELMRQLQISSSYSTLDLFKEKLTDVLMRCFEGSNLNTVKALIYETKKIEKSLKLCLNNIPNKRRYEQLVDVINKLNSLELVLSSYVFDGPVKRPILENVNVLKPIFKFQIFHQTFEKDLRKLRSEFHENISARMKSDTLWKNGHCLWIWFLTEPKKVLLALEEVRKAASNTSLSGSKTLVGIKRK